MLEIILYIQYDGQEVRHQNCFAHDVSLSWPNISPLFLQKVHPLKKLHIIYAFFLVRKIVAHIVTFVFYCVVIPTTVLVPEVHLPRWGAIYMPSVITILNAASTLRYIQIP